MSTYAAAPTASNGDLEIGGNVGVAERTTWSGSAATSTLQKNAEKRMGPTRFDRTGVLEIFFATSSAITSDCSTTLGRMQCGCMDVDASDVMLLTGSAEAPTSVRRDVEIWGCGELGGRLRMTTSLPRAPVTHGHATLWMKESLCTAGDYTTWNNRRVGTPTCLSVTAPLARWRILSLTIGAANRMAMEGPLPCHFIRQPHQRGRLSAARRRKTPSMLQRRRRLRRTDAQDVRETEGARGELTSRATSVNGVSGSWVCLV